MVGRRLGGRGVSGAERERAVGLFSPKDCCLTGGKLCRT